jgi:autophagy-related protein 18
MESQKNKDQMNILYLNFNHDYSCICIGTEKGYLIYNVSPFKEIYKRSNS